MDDSTHSPRFRLSEISEEKRRPWLRFISHEVMSIALRMLEEDTFNVDELEELEREMEYKNARIDSIADLMAAFAVCPAGERVGAWEDVSQGIILTS